LRQHQGLLGENITIFLGFDSFADDAVVGEQSDLQHGFRHSRSCETQLLSFVQELAANSDKNIQQYFNYYKYITAF
jgi:hypothetical protein